ncbi:IS3 family transposase [Paenibacillus beijingensis]|nr:IS3 family transposase [Paenibacillus beijingensis]
MHVSSYTALSACINEYITFYNSESYRWTLKRMTPDEFRSHHTAA